MADQLAKEDFESCLGQPFQLLIEHDELTEPVYLELVEVKSLGKRSNQSANVLAPPLRAEPFSLVFRGPLAVQLNQAMFVLAHENLGELNGIFLVPVWGDKSSFYYEAVFN